MMIKRLNDNHAPNLQKPTTTARAAQALIAAKSYKNTTDNVIASIGQVLRCTNYYKIEWKNGSSLTLYFNGRYEKYKRNEKLASKGGVGSRNNNGFNEKGHISIVKLVEGFKDNAELP